MPLEDRAGVEVVAVCDPGGVRLYDVQAAGNDHLEPLRAAVWTLEVVEVAHCAGGWAEVGAVDWFGMNG